MKRFYGVIGLIVASVAVLVAQPVQAASTNNFVISSYDIQYVLTSNAENRSELKTIETIVAEFPSYDQNHGLERALPLTYDGHKTNLKILSVTDGQDTLKYSTDTVNDVLILRIGDADTYVHGSNTYEITYSQNDVTRFYADTGRDEWYWDTNGIEWGVPIENLSVSAYIPEYLTDNLEGDPFCYQGVSGSSTQCSISKVSQTYSYKTSIANLNPGENVSVAFGFTEGTFAAYQPTLWEKLVGIWLLIQPFAGLFGLIVFIWVTSQYYRRRDRVRELHTIVTEFIPPKDTSVIISGEVFTPKGSVFSAQLIDLAVRHKIRIIESKPKTSIWSPAQYDIEMLVDASTLLPEEQEVLSDMYGSLPTHEKRLALDTLRNSTSYFTRASDNPAKFKALIEGEYGLREKSKKVSRFFYRWALALLIIGVLTLSIFILFFAGIIALYGFFIRPLTDKGVALRRYLMGLERYIKASEVERLKMFQAPDTVEKVGEKVDANNPGQILKLYERVLPYAILFGYQKQWSEQLGKYYQDQQASPDWYSGHAAFNAALFVTTMNSFSTSASYSGGSSSSSGGSGGGGSSGGGGGGGGGGGW